MKKRMLFTLVVLGLAIGIPVALRQYKERRVETVVEEPLTTWNSFQEYKRLQMLLKGFAVESMIDVPCCNVQALKEQDFGLKRYIGVTSSRSDARALQAQFGSEFHSFLNAEIAVDMLPQADLILCWDAFCNMPRSQVQAALLQFKKSGAKFLLLRHYPEVKKNHKNKSGDFVPINWRLSPYNFPEPIIHIMEQGEHGTKSLALWSFEDL